MVKYVLDKHQRFLILASYCDQNPECSDEKPCKACLEMCNVAVVPDGTTIDVLGWFDHNDTFIEQEELK